MATMSQVLSQPLGSARALGPWRTETCGLCWRMVDLDDRRLAGAEMLLDQGERERASRFRFERDRDRFVAAHAGLRLSLSEVLHDPPECIGIALGPHGKPMLAPARNWAFNMSHSEGWALIGVTPADRVAEVGVDIEVCRSIDDWRDLAREHFSRAEVEALAGTDEPHRSRAFLRCWTRKEACVKALGTGLTVPTRDFTAGVDAADANVAIEVEGKREHIQVRTLFETGSCIAAVAHVCRDRDGAATSAVEPVSHLTQDNVTLRWGVPWH